MLKITFGYSYNSTCIFEMSKICGSRFAFSYREKNQNEVSIKNVKIIEGKANTKFEYQRAKYNIDFLFNDGEFVEQVSEYAHEEFGKFIEIYSV